MGGNAYSVISAKEVTADGRRWRVLRVRNPWGKNPSAEWTGALGDDWPEWPRYPQLRQALKMGNAALDGMFWMSWDDFRNRFSDVGLVPKSMEVPKAGHFEGDFSSPKDGAKHAKQFSKGGAPGPAPAMSPGVPVPQLIMGAPRVMAAAPPALTVQS